MLAAPGLNGDRLKKRNRDHINMWRARVEETVLDMAEQAKRCCRRGARVAPCPSGAAGRFRRPGVFPDGRGGWRDRNNVGKSFRQVRDGSDFAWVETHTYRKTVATLLDQSGASARMIADQLGQSRVSMT